MLGKKIISGDRPKVDELLLAIMNTAHAELTFSHWRDIQGDVFEPSLSASYVHAIRKRKNLRENIPPTDLYIDKL